MVDLLPHRPEVTPPADPDPVVIDLTSDEVEAVINSLASETARDILATLYDNPQPTSDIADHLDMSLQNVDYHLTKLRDAGLVEVVDTWYSQTGNEMNVYAPAAGAVMVTPDRESASAVRSVAATLFGVLVGLAIVTAIFRSVLVEILLDWGSPLADDSVPDGDVMAQSQPADPLGALPATLDPAVVFVLGGITTMMLGILVLGLRAR